MTCELTAEERSILRLANNYGDGLDLSGPRVALRAKGPVRRLIELGLLSGTIKSLNITAAGQAALK